MSCGSTKFTTARSVARAPDLFPSAATWSELRDAFAPVAAEAIAEAHQPRMDSLLDSVSKASARLPAFIRLRGTGVPFTPEEKAACVAVAQLAAAVQNTMPVTFS